MSLRILLAHNRYLIRGGEDESYDSELSLLRNHGCEVTEYLENNQKIEHLGKLATAARTIWSEETFRRVTNILSEKEYDLVYVQNFFPLISPSIYYAAHSSGVPVIQTIRNYRLLCLNGYLFRQDFICEDCIGKMVPFPGIQHACYRDNRAGSLVVAAMLSYHRARHTWSKMVDGYLALTEFSKEKLIQGGLPSNRIWLKPNFVNEQPESGPGNENIAVFAGRFSSEKGIDILLDAWSKQKSSLSLKLIGDGPLAERISQKVIGISNVEWLGRLTYRETLDWIGRARFLVFPSLWYEGMPRTIIEAYAKGTPVIASRLGGMVEMVKEGETGMLFQPGNSNELAIKIQQMAEISNNESSFRINARLEYESKYLAEQNWERFLQIYDEITIRKVKNGAF
jgi:glycosyltransferase involved in cell wall biosynthesis